MSPSAEPASAHAAAESIDLGNLLSDGEVVLLAIKPSSWFVLLISLPVVTVAALIGAGAYLADKLTSWEGISLPILGMFCVGVVCLRIVVATVQWLGRLYVLTNLRVLRIHGTVRTDLVACSLRDLDPPLLSVSAGERAFGLGSLYFQSRGTHTVSAGWAHIANPHEVHRTVQDAIARAR